MQTNFLSALKYVVNKALTHTVAALFPEIPQAEHAVFTAGAVSIGGTALTKLLQETQRNEL